MNPLHVAIVTAVNDLWGGRDWVFAIIVELLFALAINVISYRQLQKLKLTDITK